MIKLNCITYCSCFDMVTSMETSNRNEVYTDSWHKLAACQHFFVVINPCPANPGYILYGKQCGGGGVDGC